MCHITKKNISINAIIDTKNQLHIYLCDLIKEINNFNVKTISFISKTAPEIKCIPEFHIHKSKELIGKIYGFKDIITFNNSLEKILEYYGIY